MSLQEKFLLAIGELGYTDLKKFVSKEGAREKKTLRTKAGAEFTYWISGIRPISFVVESKEHKAEILFQVPD